MTVVARRAAAMSARTTPSTTDISRSARRGVRLSPVRRPARASRGGATRSGMLPGLVAAVSGGEQHPHCTTTQEKPEIIPRALREHRSDTSRSTDNMPGGSIKLAESQGIFRTSPHQCRSMTAS